MRTTSTTYTDRTVDLNVMGLPDPTNPSKQPLSLAQPATVVTGVQKLAQRYLIALTTEQGSVAGFPLVGTDLSLFSSKNNDVLSLQDLTHRFNFQNLQVTLLFRQYQAQNPGLPLDEQLDYQQLLSSSISQDSLSLNIQLVSLAGSTVTVVLPLNSFN